MQLHPAAAGYRLSAHETLPSTNTEALTRARRGAAVPIWITAGRQTAGRGRRDNAWISEPGNLYATLLTVDPAPADKAPELSFVAALAVHDAIVEQAPALPGDLTLKWPNDVLFAGAKLAGILIESETVEAGLAVAIGIGVNCRHHPANTEFPATDLASAGVAVAAEDLFLALSGAMVHRLEQWRRGSGFAAIRNDWLKRAAGIGNDIRVRLPDREIIGRAEALDDHGRLLLRQPDGVLHTVAAGDVFPMQSHA